MGGGANCVALGDLDGDGRLDIATANRDSQDVSVLFADAGGGFREEVRYSAGEQPCFPNFLALRDMNADGRLDIATANDRSNDVSVLLARPDGGFQDAQHYRVGLRPLAVALTDLDGYGLDILVANYGSDDVSVLLQLRNPCVPGAAFVRGDVGGRSFRGSLPSDGSANLTDAVRILGHLFLGTLPVLECEKAADVNDSGGIDLNDAVRLLRYLFFGDAAPAPPFPGPGNDPTADGLSCCAYSGGRA